MNPDPHAEPAASCRRPAAGTRRLKSFACLAAIAACAIAPAAARADQAADAFNAWNAAFLVQTGDQTYYSTTVTTAGTVRSGTWVGALDIAVAEDAYQRTHSAADRQRVSDLLTTFIAAEGTDWSGDTWDAAGTTNTVAVASGKIWVT